MIDKTSLSKLTSSLISTKLAPAKLDETKAKTARDEILAPQTDDAADTAYVKDQITISKAGISGVGRSGPDEMEALLKGKAITDQANASLQKIELYLNALKNNLATMTNANLSGDARDQYKMQYQAIVDEISSEIKNGGPLLNSTDGFEISINGGQGKITLSGTMLEATIQANLSAVPQTAEESINMLLGGFTNVLNTVNSLAMDVGIGNGRINDQIAFLKAKAEAVTPPKVKMDEIRNGMTETGADAKSAVKVAIAGADQVTLALGKLRSVASILADENLSQQGREDYQRLYTSLRQQAFDFLQGSGDSGFNFLTGTQSTSVTYHQSGASVNIPGFDLNAQLNRLLPPQINSTGDLQNFFAGIDTVMQQVQSSQNQLQAILLTLSGGGGRR